jgi:hypothetical protein
MAEVRVQRQAALQEPAAVRTPPQPVERADPVHIGLSHRAHAMHDTLVHPASGQRAGVAERRLHLAKTQPLVQRRPGRCGVQPDAAHAGRPQVVQQRGHHRRTQPLSARFRRDDDLSQEARVAIPRRHPDGNAPAIAFGHQAALRIAGVEAVELLDRLAEPALGLRQRCGVGEVVGGHGANSG